MKWTTAAPWWPTASAFPPPVFASMSAQVLFCFPLQHVRVRVKDAFSLCIIWNFMTLYSTLAKRLQFKCRYHMFDASV